MNPLDVVIPVYNALEYLQTCLEGLDRFYPDRRLILVDDNSPDGSVNDFYNTYLLGKFFTLSLGCTKVIRRSKRGWFTRVVNDGLKEALGRDGEWLLVLNQDCRIGEGCLEEMKAVYQEVGQRDRVGMVGAEGPRDKNHPRYLVKSEPGYVTGHALLLKKSTLREYGLRFPVADGEVTGFTADQLVHISSDRALSYQMNRKGLLTVASYWSNLGHVGGRSWEYHLNEIPAASTLEAS